MAPRPWREGLAPRARRRSCDALPDLLEVIARELRAGRNLHHAVAAGAADPVARETGIDRALHEVATGRRLVDAVDRWAAELRHPDGDLIRAVLTLAAGTGGAMAASIERAAATLRERAAAREELRALTAQVRVSVVLLVVAPVVFLLLVAAVDPSVVALTLRRPLGWGSLLLGVGLDGLGFWWMRRLIDGVAG